MGKHGLTLLLELRMISADISKETYAYGTHKVQIHAFYHSDEDIWKVYFSRDPTVYQTYHQTILLPIGSAPGTWGLAEMVLFDKAGNRLQVDFTEIVRFEVIDAPIYTHRMSIKMAQLTFRIWC